MKFVKITKKVVFKGMGDITIYPGTVMRVVRGSRKHYLYLTPISEAVRARIPKDYKYWMDGGMPFLAHQYGGEYGY